MCRFQAEFWRHEDESSTHALGFQGSVGVILIETRTSVGAPLSSTNTQAVVMMSVSGRDISCSMRFSGYCVRKHATHEHRKQTVTDAAQQHGFAQPRLLWLIRVLLWYIGITLLPGDASCYFALVCCWTYVRSFTVQDSEPHCHNVEIQTRYPARVVLL